MGTRCDMFVEKENGQYIGVQCFFDGYPERMINELRACTYEALNNYIIVAGSRGGFRLFSPTSGESEYLDDTPLYLYDPFTKKTDADYIYILNLNKKIQWRSPLNKDWITE